MRAFPALACCWLIAWYYATLKCKESIGAVSNSRSKAWNTPGQPLAIWSIWTGSEEFGNKSVRFSYVRSFWNRVDRAPIQLAKSESVGCWPSEPLDILIGCVLAIWPFWLAVCQQISVVCGRGGIRCAALNSMVCILFLYTIRFLFSCFGLLARD